MDPLEDLYQGLTYDPAADEYILGQDADIGWADDERVCINDKGERRIAADCVSELAQDRLRDAARAPEGE